jgi:multidrug resistance efflux pump
MLNISEERIDKRLDVEKYLSPHKLKPNKWAVTFSRWLLILLAIFILALFLPWTQNIRARGKVTSFNPTENPQTIQSRIDGMIAEWFVQEGQVVNAGDTLARLTEIKDEYFDPDLLGRTGSQVDAQQQANNSYLEKAKAIELQLQALESTRQAKLQQAKNKITQSRLQVKADSADWVAASVGLAIADSQFRRQESLFSKGLISRTDLENRQNKLQESFAKQTAAKNKFEASRAELSISRTEISAIENDFDEKISKASGERFTALSQYYDGESKLNKLQNSLANYSIRRDNYFITAPQTGLVAETMRSGLGETVKQGESIATIVPLDYSHAVEIFVEPMDLPLIHKGEFVRLLFDGWPAIVFAGWPNTSYGTFGGKVVAVDRAIGSDGKFKVLIQPDPEDIPWPEAIRIGTGANAIALLNEVPVWYELWRQLNGFPPDYYLPSERDTTNQTNK